MKTLNKVFGILAAMLMIFSGIGATTAATSGDVGTSATIAQVLGLTVSPSSITYTPVAANTDMNPSAQIHIVNTGNTIGNVMVKRVAPLSKLTFKNPYNDAAITETDAIASGGLIAGGNADLIVKAQVPDMLPGTFTDILRFTIVAV